MLDVRRPRNLERVALLMAVAFVAVVISPNFGAIVSTYDGGISSSAATFTLHGLLPYRDYWLSYGPLSGWLLAVPTAVFGPSVELTRALGFVIFCGQGLVAYRLARVWAAPGPAVALAVASVVMVPALLSLDVAAWPLAMLFALAALYASIGTRRGGAVVGILVGLAFLSRWDVGLYVLVACVLVRDRRWVLAGFTVVAVPFIVVALATTAPDAIYEQLIWFPIVGNRQFRSVSGIEVAFGPVVTAALNITLVWLPRLAIVVAGGRLAVQAARRSWDSKATGLLALTAFAALCQLQTSGRADAEHFAQAATPAILVWSVWFAGPRISLARIGVLAGITTASVVIGVARHQFHQETAIKDRAIYDRVHVAASDYIEPRPPVMSRSSWASRRTALR